MSATDENPTTPTHGRPRRKSSRKKAAPRELVPPNALDLKRRPPTFDIAAFALAADRQAAERKLSQREIADLYDRTDVLDVVAGHPELTLDTFVELIAAQDTRLLDHGSKLLRAKLAARMSGKKRTMRPQRSREPAEPIAAASLPASQRMPQAEGGSSRPVALPCLPARSRRRRRCSTAWRRSTATERGDIRRIISRA